jgi:hypothetical protein
MTAMFPGSGVPASEAVNSILDPATTKCDELWYSTSRCQPRFDPAAANAVLAELVNLINKGEVNYDCSFLDQVQLAVRYLIQRAIPCGTILVGGGAPSNAYTGTLDPPATRYNDFMTLRILPQIHNTGASTLNINGLGARPILRNDGQQVKAFDLLAQGAPFPVPIEVIYWGGNWFCVGLVMSQVPSLKFGEIDGWVRTDGNDVTGDGTEPSGPSTGPMRRSRHATRRLQCLMSLSDLAFPAPTPAPRSVHTAAPSASPAIRPTKVSI